jgi:N-carbamoylputrescine amidase
MARTVKGGLIQVKADVSSRLHRRCEEPDDREDLPLVEDAGRKGVRSCLQELFYGPYFCAEQKTRWYELTEHIPDGRRRRCSRRWRSAWHGDRSPIYEEEISASTTTPPP